MNIFIAVEPADGQWFNDNVAKRNIPSKDSCVLVKKIARNKTFTNSFMVNEHLIILNILIQNNFFILDLMVQRISIIHKPSVSVAYVKFSRVEDVEIAIKRSDKTSDIQILSASEIQMETEF